MTKTVMAGVIGMLIKDGKLSLDSSRILAGHDGREKIRLKDLLAMSSGLQWNEAYGAVSDVTSMLYLQPDMAAFARSPTLGASARRGVAVLQRHGGHSVAHRSGRAGARRRAAQDLSTFIKARLFSTPRDHQRDDRAGRTRHPGGLLLYVCHRARLGPLWPVPAARRHLAGRRIAPAGLRHHDGDARGSAPAANTAWAKPGCGDRMR